MTEVHAVVTIPKDVKPGKDIYPEGLVIKKGQYIINQWEYGKKLDASDTLNLTNKDTHEWMCFLLYNPEKYTKNWVVTTEYE